MNRQRNISDEELDLLAEGELTTTQREDLFRRLDEEPGQWRDCAMALLEANAVRHSLRKLANASCALVDGEVQVEVARECVSQTDGDPLASAKPLTARTGRMRRRTFGYILAASIVLVLIAAGVGYQLGGLAGRDTLATHDATIAKPVTEKDEQEDRQLEAGARSALQRLSVEDEKLLAVVRLDDGDDARFVPVVSSDTLAQRLRQTPVPSISPEQIQRANRSGWNVLRHRQLIAIERPDANVDVIPVQMVRYRFVGKELL